MREAQAFGAFAPFAKVSRVLATGAAAFKPRQTQPLCGTGCQIPSIWISLGVVQTQPTCASVSPSSTSCLRSSLRLRLCPLSFNVSPVPAWTSLDLGPSSSAVFINVTNDGIGGDHGGRVLPLPACHLASISLSLCWRLVQLQAQAPCAALFSSASICCALL